MPQNTTMSFWLLRIQIKVTMGPMLLHKVKRRKEYVAAIVLIKYEGVPLTSK